MSNRMGRLGRGLGISLLALLLMVVPGRTAEEALTYYDNVSSAVVHTGSWTINGSGWPRAYNTSVSYSNASSAKVSLNFYGNSITRIYTKASNRGQADIYIDGNFKEVMNDATPAGAPTTRWQAAKTWTLPTGSHNIEVRRITGYVDADAFISDITTVGNGTYDTNHAQIKYIGNWAPTNTSFTASYGNTLRWTNTQEDAVTFTFVGDAITYLYTKGSNRGMAAVTIDGVDKGLLDMYSADARFQQGTTYSGLGSGTHTIQIAATNQKNGSSSGYYIDIDALKVGAVYNRTAAGNYADAWAHARNANYPNYGNPSDNPCNDCTNFISQVLEAGGIPQIAYLGSDNQYYWYTYYIAGWLSSYTWRITTASDLPSIKAHADVFPARYQFTGSSRSAVESLNAGDFVLMDLDTGVFSFDHASIIMGRGYPEEGDRKNEELVLRNAHCTDRKRVRWDFNVPANTPLQAYRVVY